jgi:hypothetical protein
MRLGRHLPAAFDAVDRRHPHIQDRHVRAPALGELDEHAAVGSLTDDAQVVLRLEYRDEPPPQRLVVVTDHAADLV